MSKKIGFLICNTLIILISTACVAPQDGSSLNSAKTSTSLALISSSSTQAPPTGVTVSDIGTGSFVVKYDLDNNAYQHQVACFLQSSPNAGFSNSENGSTSCLIDTALQVNTSSAAWNCSITAIGPNGTSSPVLFSVTELPPIIQLPPTGVFVSNITSGSFVVNYDQDDDSYQHQVACYLHRLPHAGFSNSENELGSYLVDTATQSFTSHERWDCTITSIGVHGHSTPVAFSVVEL